MLSLRPVHKSNKAIEFCNNFLYSDRPKYIFGRSSWADSIAQLVDVDGFIDDYTSETTYLGKPIVSISDIPENALVVSTIIGKPLIAEKRLKTYCFDSLDYFSFYKHSKLPVKPPMFWEGMKEDIEENFEQYVWIYNILSDQVSKNQFANIVNFRYAYDIDYMRGFTNQEEKQYFETFLPLHDHEVFVDIGGYDGYTTEYFISQVSSYKSILFFEPDKKNITIAKKRLSQYNNIVYFQVGASNTKEQVSFDSNASSSKITQNGSITIFVDKLDNLIKEEVTFIKMDIEGAEPLAIEGAETIIKKFHPKLAISVYHGKDHFWSIPRQILNIRDDYEIYLRHYTEGVSETIMYFIPRKKQP